MGKNNCFPRHTRRRRPFNCNYIHHIRGLAHKLTPVSNAAKTEPRQLLQEECGAHHSSAGSVTVKCSGTFPRWRSTEIITFVYIIIAALPVDIVPIISIIGLCAKNTSCRNIAGAGGARVERASFPVCLSHLPDLRVHPGM
ncbi:unnamed protein product [Pleuronectes platessa]|uniref:Uncharacterized protein n=1 Tax=Pleuronectes platessa TaxID=8262 RepID=A0A9N7V6B2_PLEPL|nr:unnamed protein product [Pleuronectes platessa]